MVGKAEVISLQTAASSIHFTRRKKFSLWPGTYNLKLTTASHGPQRTSRAASGESRRLPFQRRRRPRHLRRQSARPPKSRPLLLPRIPLDRRKNRLARQRNRRPRNHRRRQRARSARPRKQSHQAIPPEVQHYASGRQNLSLHQIHRRRKISPRLFHPPHHKRRFALLRPVFPRQPRAPHSPLRPQAFSRSILHRRSHASTPAPLSAISHSSLPRTLRSRTHHRRALCRSRPGCPPVPRRPPPRSRQKSGTANGNRGGKRTLRTSRRVSRPSAHAGRHRRAPAHRLR